MQSQWTYSHGVISPLQNTFEPLWMRKNLANWLKNPSILREPQGMKTWEFFLWFQPLSCLPRPGIFFWLLFYFPFLVIQVLNFKLIPVAHQLNFCLAVSLEWATILSVIRAQISRHQANWKKPNPQILYLFQTVRLKWLKCDCDIQLLPLKALTSLEQLNIAAPRDILSVKLRN